MSPNVTRRRFLTGAGGASLALPFLPSLDSVAYGATPLVVHPPRFAAFATAHGSIGASSMYPSESVLTKPTELFAGHTIRSGKLVRSVNGGVAQVSTVLRGPASMLTDSLVSKMNVLRGIDIPFYIGHHTGGHLGNFLRSDQGPQNLTPMSTIDQVMAWSSSFYPDTAGVRMRSMVTGYDFRGISFGYSSPSTKSGNIQAMECITNGSLFDRVFGGSTMVPATPSAPKPKLIVDRVLESYRDMQKNLRLSTADKQRLNDHMDRMSELQRKLIAGATTPTLSRSCGSFKKPVDDFGDYNSDRELPKGIKFHPLINDIVAAAFMCGASRIATIHVINNFADYRADWHENVAHKNDQNYLVLGAQNSFRYAVLDLASKLDVEESPGVSLLDNTLVQWTQEAGIQTHDAQAMPVITFGGGARGLNTSMYVDYRATNRPGAAILDGKEFAGLTLRQWLATALQTMGVPRSEFERNGKPGYGDPFLDAKFNTIYASQVISGASEYMPLLKA